MKVTIDPKLKTKCPRTALGCVTAQVEAGARQALLPFEDGRGTGTGSDSGPFQVQQDLQKTMQDLVGIVRNQSEMAHALDALSLFRTRSARIRIGGNRAYNPAWHTALDLRNLLTVSEAITRAALERKESRGAHFRDDFPDKDPAAARFNVVVLRDGAGAMRVRREPIAEMPAHLKQVIEEMK